MPPVFNKFKEAAPVRLAVIVLAVKLPEESRATIAEYVLLEVAFVEIVISFVFVVMLTYVSARSDLKFSVLPL